MKKKLILIAIMAILILSTGVISASAQDLPVVRAILFYSPSCPHCEQVITQDLPPLVDQYGDQLLILYIDVSTQGGSSLFTATITEMEHPQDQTGVPFMVVGENILIGSGQIPAELPGIIEDGLANGGIDWPPAPTLIEVLTTNGFIDPETGAGVTPTPAESAEATATPEEQASATPEEMAATETSEEVTPSTAPTEAAAPTEAPTREVEESENISFIDTQMPDEQGLNFTQFGERFAQDPTANTIALVVLIGMVGLVIWIVIQFMQASTPKMWPEYILPILLVLGLGIAIYLATVEVTGNEAFCGPVGDCNAVQSSKYAKVFGIPVAILGMIGYVSIGASWLVSRTQKGMTQFYAKMAMFLFAIAGLLFFIYLTFLEPFVIGATCAWCITSAIIFSLINLYTTPVALNAWAEIDLDMDDYDDNEEYEEE